jgi:hypothetical protein
MTEAQKISCLKILIVNDETDIFTVVRFALHPHWRLQHSHNGRWPKCLGHLPIN